jgi:hypothetical protein
VLRRDVYHCLPSAMTDEPLSGIAADLTCLIAQRYVESLT